MPRPPRMQTPPPDRHSVENHLVTLVNDFQSTWQDFFCEAELQAQFYHRCRDAFPRYKTDDGIETTTFHHRYPSFWRHLDGDQFAEHHPIHGNYTDFDFVVLKDTFLQQEMYDDITNREELSKNLIRYIQRTDRQSRRGAVQFAIEIKLATQGTNGIVAGGDINRLEDRLLDSVRKLAAERIRQAYLVGFSQGPQPDLSRAQAIISICLQLFQARYPAGQLGVLIATPYQTVLGGDWSAQVEFPHVVYHDSRPVVPETNEDSIHQYLR